MSHVGGEATYQGKKEIFSSRVRAGSRIYYFDIKKNSKDDNYLVISESKHAGSDKEKQRHRIMVFQEDIEKFSNSFFQVIGYFLEHVVAVHPSELEDITKDCNSILEKLRSLAMHSHNDA